MIHPQHFFCERKWNKYEILKEVNREVNFPEEIYRQVKVQLHTTLLNDGGRYWKHQGQSHPPHGITGLFFQRDYLRIPDVIWFNVKCEPKHWKSEQRLYLRAELLFQCRLILWRMTLFLSETFNSFTIKQGENFFFF